MGGALRRWPARSKHAAQASQQQRSRRCLPPSHQRQGTRRRLARAQRQGSRRRSAQAQQQRSRKGQECWTRVSATEEKTKLVLQVSALKSEPSGAEAADHDEQDHDEKEEEEEPTVDEPEEEEEESTPKSKDDADAKVQAKGKAKPKLTFKLPGEPGADVPKNQTQPLKGCLRTSMRKPASASRQSIADELMQKQRAARDEKRQQEMGFGRKRGLPALRPRDE